MENAVSHVAGKDLHVVLLEGAWAITREGRKGSISVHESKQEAIDEAHKLARKEGVRVLVHGRSGQVFLPPVLKSRISEKSIRGAVRGVMLDQSRSRKPGKKVKGASKRSTAR